MTAITDKANLEYRDMESPGSSVPNDPEKSGIRELFAVIDVALSSLGVNGAITVKKATKALLDADLAHIADTLAVVYNDSTSANNGIYAKVGGSGSGSWAITALALPASFSADLAEVLASVGEAEAAATAAAASEVSAAADAGTAASERALAQTARTGAETARDIAEDARDDALAYAELTGPFEYYATKSAANAALAGLPANQLVQVWADESQGGARTVYRKVSGSYVLQTTLDYVTTSGTATLSNKTFDGETDFLLNGDRIVITSEGAIPSSPVGILHVQNENVWNVGILVNCNWEGATGTPYDNNDTTLFVTYNKTLSDSSNRSWSASCSNNYNDIPVGVRDGGSRVGVIGWAGSVAAAGYSHAGTLAEQYGVRGTAGFQGTGTPTTAVVENAIGVEGLIISASTGATIENAVAGRFIVDTPTGVIQDSVAIYARAAPGTVSTYSFYGAGGPMFNVDPIVCDDYIRAEKFLVNGNVLVDADGTNHRFYRVSGDTFLYAGSPEVLGRHDTWRFGNQALSVDYLTMAPAGIRMALSGPYADNAAAVAAGKAVNTLYKTATGEVRIVV